MGMPKPANVKTFHDLVSEVQKPGYCGKCGGCVSFCSADLLGALTVDRSGMPVFGDEEKCLHCGICYLICPNTTDLDWDLKCHFNWKPPIGRVRELASARTTDNRVAEKCTDGGVVTSLLLYLLDKGLIEGALVSRSKGPFQRAPILATTREEILSAAGSHFDESFPVIELGATYSTYSPTLYELKRLRGTNTDRVAMVGTPCQIRTVRKMQVLGVIPADIIKYCFGLFCWENFSFGDIEKNRLGRKYDFQIDEVVKVNVKHDFCAYLRDGRTVHIPLGTVDSIARPACLVCPDFSAEFSDFSFGGLGSPDGYTTAVIRSEKGHQVYGKALAAGYIKEREYASGQKARSDRANIERVIVDFAKKKKARALRNHRRSKTEILDPSAKRT